MDPKRSYAETVDQAKLSASFDLTVAYKRCRSFKHMVKAFGQLAAGAGAPIAVWPPAEWKD